MKMSPGVLVTGFFMLLLGGCSFAGLAYNNAPAYIVGEIEDAFDLNPAQSSELDSRLERFFTWHRQEELVRYRELLQRAAVAAADGITASEFLTLRNEIDAAMERSIEKAIDSLGDLFAALTPRQIEQYRRYHRESSEEYRDYLEKSAQQREIYRLDVNFKRLENWFGKFDYPLDQKITRRLDQLPDIYEPWIAYRDQRHAALVDAMRQGLTGQRLKAIMLDPSTAHARAFAPARRAYRLAYAQALEEISSWLSERQRQHAVERLQRYARLVERLHRPG